MQYAFHSFQNKQLWGEWGEDKTYKTKCICCNELVLERGLKIVLSPAKRPGQQANDCLQRIFHQKWAEGAEKTTKTSILKD